jgi:hypothetical protein
MDILAPLHPQHVAPNGVCTFVELSYGCCVGSDLLQVGAVIRTSIAVSIDPRRHC